MAVLGAVFMIGRYSSSGKCAETKKTSEPKATGKTDSYEFIQSTNDDAWKIIKASPLSANEDLVRNSEENLKAWKKDHPQHDEILHKSIAHYTSHVSKPFHLFGKEVVIFHGGKGPPTVLELKTYQNIEKNWSDLLLNAKLKDKVDTRRHIGLDDAKIQEIIQNALHIDVEEDHDGSEKSE